MELEVVPPLSEAERHTLTLALTRAAVRLDGSPDPYAGEWRRVAAREGVHNEPTLDRYTRSPRSTRGATRA